jgi:alkylation response protein AidB-like acyl-CoA dehydrogenase
MSGEDPMFDAEPEELPAWIRTAPRFCEDPVKTARELRPILEAGAAQGAREAKLTEEVLRALAGSGLFGLRISRQFGGIEADPRPYIDAISELSYADGSAGWVIMASTFSAGSIGLGLGPGAIEQLYGTDGGFMAAGQISTLGKAEAVAGGGYRISGLFHFGSGSQIASWFLGAFQLHEDGKPVFENGRPKVITCCAPRRDIRLRGNWDVMGLAATGSYDFEFPEQEIHPDYVAGLPGRPSRAGPIHAVGVSIGHVAWALGVGDRALDEIKQLAMSKRRFQRATLIDQPSFQQEYGRHRAALDACRALTYAVFDEWFEAAKQGPVSLELRAKARQASCWATEAVHKAAQFAQFAAGSDGVRNRDGENRLQRVFRDIQTGSTHRHVDGNILIEAAQIGLGVADLSADLLTG